MARATSKSGAREKIRKGRPDDAPDPQRATEKDTDPVALKLLHTADWHLGRRFQSFDADDEKQLTRARLQVLDNIFALARQHAVDAVLCAGDLFDHPSPEKDWWGPLAQKLSAMEPRTVVLLPGNHDPLMAGSVWHPTHPFRAALPRHVHVVDRDDFTLALNDAAILHARPCRSQAGQDDLAMALPARAAGDTRIRIGLVHGSTFDMADAQTNFPISKDAAKARGFDYLAIGDTHSFRVVPPNAMPPVVYPGAPEPTSFGEPDAGKVALVFVSASRRVRVEAQPVAQWQWEERTIRSVGELRELAAAPRLGTKVMRLVLDARLTAPELAEAERLLEQLAGTSAVSGRVGILQVERKRWELDIRGIETELADLPAVLRSTVAKLKALEGSEQDAVARAALYHLFQLAQELRAS